MMTNGWEKSLTCQKKPFIGALCEANSAATRSCAALGALKTLYVEVLAPKEVVSEVRPHLK